jgi:phosphopantothenoylcysteine decarboxylase/phosphopantothenate--cysteine ligase
MNVDAIIDQLGGTAAVQTLLGVGASAVSNYRLRRDFPEYARIKIWQALKARGIEVDPETLELVGAPIRPEEDTAAAPSILLIISGGIAAYKMLECIRRMKDKGWHVRVILTKNGAEFITPLSVSALSGEKTFTDLFSLTDEDEMGHIRLARDADLVIVAPATANIIARMSQGMGDDLATTAILATDAPILIAPAMNPFMWLNPATEVNVRTLRQRGFRFIGPDHGDTACGEGGGGRLAEPMAIITAAEQTLPKQARLKGQRIVITSGPTHEPIDGVRYIANRSSGKQGQAIAEVLSREGAFVHLITGPVDLPPPAGVEITRITTAREMLAATINALPADVVICTAAVADWAVEGASAAKIKKTKGIPPELKFIENPDILASISAHARRPKLVIGFAAETDKVVAHGDDKRRRKGCDWILANDVGQEQSVFGSDDNQVHFITATGATAWPRMSKHDVAEHLTTEIIKELTHD